MRVAILRPLLVLLLGSAAVLAAQQPAPASGPTKQMQPADLKAWKTIRQSVLSNDGKWFAYVLAPNEGDANVIIRSTGADDKEMNVPDRRAPTPRSRRRRRTPWRGPDAGGGPLSISADSRWVAFTVYPPAATGRGAAAVRVAAVAAAVAGPGGRRHDAAPAPQNKMALVNLATGEKKEFDRVRRFAFNGDKPTWLAMQSFRGAGRSGGNGASGAARGGGGGGTAGGAAARPRRGHRSRALQPRDGDAVNVGNVAEFGFDDSGEWLAYTIDARDQIGNGVQLRNMKHGRRASPSTRIARCIVTSCGRTARRARRASRHASTRLRATRSTRSSRSRTSRRPPPKKTVFDAAQHADFPTGMAVAVERAPRLADDFSAVFFGIHEAKKPGDRLLAGSRELGDPSGRAGDGRHDQPAARQRCARRRIRRSFSGTARIRGSSRSRSCRKRRTARSTTCQSIASPTTSSCSWRTSRCAPSTSRRTTTSRIGTDTREYDNNASYTGRVLRRRLHGRPSHRQARPRAQEASPGGSRRVAERQGRALLGRRRQLLGARSRDRRQAKHHEGGRRELLEHRRRPQLSRAAADARRSVGRRTAASVLLSDGFDVWKVPANGSGSAVNLTVDGKKNQIRYQRLYAFERGVAPAAAWRRGRGGRGGGGGAVGRHRSVAAAVLRARTASGRRRKGLAKVDPSQAGRADARVGRREASTFQKAKDADVYVYTQQTASRLPELLRRERRLVTGVDGALKSARQLTDANPQQKDFAWTSGVKLINYTSAKGDKLQGALYLPANYEPGKKYPLLVTIYEKRSNLANSYVTPSETSTPNRSIYTSRGYAVLDPDIVYRVNDPGMSAVWCVIPAVKAAIATGMIDSANVGLWGHSWGGYQTAFLVTQTNIFKAAIAGAPLTDMVSMYGSIYWNTGGADQAIFESSQGRFKGNFADNYDAYIRNSPVFHAEEREDAAHHPGQRQGRRGGLQSGHHVLQHAAPDEEGRDPARVRG